MRQIYLLFKVAWSKLFSHWVVSDPLQPHGPQHARLPRPYHLLEFANSCPLSWWCYPTILYSIAPFSSCLIQRHMEFVGTCSTTLTDHLKILQETRMWVPRPQKEQRWKDRLFFKEIRFLQKKSGPRQCRGGQRTLEPLHRLFQNSHFQPLTGGFPPKANIYRVVKIQHKSPGHEVPLLVPKISGLESLSRTSWVSTMGQGNPWVKKNWFWVCIHKDKGCIFSRKCFQFQEKKGF